jgi:ferric-dicitrate binding protein FerR (iron transport regulator)
VELTGGEAYFEITHRAGQPFTVHVSPLKPGRASLAVEVLGTNFDINDYADEPAIRTTLLAGSVKVNKGEQSVLLHPGQQAQANDNSKLITVNTSVDATGEVAWKDGLFSFDRVGIEAVMRQLARWYDVEISYEGKIPARQFVGTIPRNAPASDVLKILALNKVHFMIKGKKIIVMP